MAQAPTAAPPPKGLSSVPKRAVDLEPALLAPPVLRFPGTELVTAAAGLFHKVPAWDGCEGPAFRLQVSAGTVGVVLERRAVRERNALNALGHDTRGTREVLASPWLVEQSEEGDVYWERAGLPEWREPREARAVTGWSRKSRSRMVRRLAQLDWSPLYAEGRPAVLLTLTYPGRWEEVAGSGKVVKAHLKAFYKRWERRWGSAFVGPWKLEFQARGAPHVHLLTVAPADPTFRGWLSKTWAAIVAHPDAEERRKHQLVGTGVDYVRGGRCFDPKRAAVYFSKHGGAAGGKEYQHNVPALWQQQGNGPGRFWGYRGLEPVVAEVLVEPADYVQLRRTLRRWSQAQGLTRTVRVPRGAMYDTATGERVFLEPGDSRAGVVSARRRTVTRRKRFIGAGGLIGGTVLVNDGPAFAAALSRHPALCEE